MEKESKFFSKRNIIIIDIIIVSIIAIFLAKLGIDKLILSKELKNAEHAITAVENVHIYSSPKEKKKYDSVEIGADTYILKTVTDKDDNEWYKVKIGDRVRICESKRN